MKTFIPLMRVKVLSCLALTILFLSCSNKATVDKKDLAIIPEPNQIETLSGTFDFSNSLTISGRQSANEVEYLKVTFSKLGIELKETENADITLSVDASISENKEAYKLEVTESGVKIIGSTNAAVFYGSMSLIQLVNQAVLKEAGRYSIPALSIQDEPRFQYRGMHLDVSRHFFDVDQVKRYIDFLALYKLNTFHWHLTDDQGWRIEIKKYPKLTEIGAVRKETLKGHYSYFPQEYDDETYGPYFYTQEEVKEVVEYAQKRHITIVPEIEMPGHATAAVAAYPKLGCTKKQIDVTGLWGVFEDVYQPSEYTFNFLEDVLVEVMELFPGDYIHIGGDECPKTQWLEDPFTQKLMKREGLKDGHEVQSYFIHRIDKFITSKGRKMIGWDEILEGGLSPNATVMSWRGIKGGIEAAKEKHDVIMTPTSHMYFDFYQSWEDEPITIDGHTTVEKVYDFDPVPVELKGEQAKYVIGVQANIWTEYVLSDEHLEYMQMPRLLALSEVAWTDLEHKDYQSYKERQKYSLKLLDRYGAQYRIPRVKNYDKVTYVDETKTKVEFENPTLDGVIVYTLDGSEPSKTSTKYEGSFELDLTEDVYIKTKVLLPNGRISGTRTMEFRNNTPVKAVKPLKIDAGLTYQQYLGQFTKLSDLENAKKGTSGIVNTVRLPDDKPENYFGYRFDGFIRVDSTGIYDFSILVNDAVRLEIAGKEVILSDYRKYTRTVTGKMALEAGLHPIHIDYFKAAMGDALNLKYALEGRDLKEVPSNNLFH